MTIFTGTYVPYEYDNKRDVLKYVESRCHGIKKSLRFVEKDNEHLTVRCPLSGDYLDITGSQGEIDWLDNELNKKNWYRT
jgi:hypothetical protein